MRLREPCWPLIIIMIKVSISRSVGRAFAVLELFRDQQKSARATQISRSLDAPHSSVVAVLQNLRELGFLSFDETNMTYFPNAKLRDLTTSLRPPSRNPGQLSGLMEHPRTVRPAPEFGAAFPSHVQDGIASHAGWPSGKTRDN